MSNKEYLRPLFERIESFVANNAIHPLPQPDPRSSLGREDIILSAWPTSHLVRGAVGAGVGHVDVLRRSVIQLRVIDAHAPWTLLRAALEDFATAVWLLFGTTRTERLTRTLRLWAYDFKERGQWEHDASYAPTGPQAKSGDERRREVLDAALDLGLDPEVIARRPTHRDILESASEHVGLDPSSVRASWRIASGFAHGRMWPNIRAASPAGAQQTSDGWIIAFVIDDDQLAELASCCIALLDHAVTRHHARSGVPPS